MRLSVASSTKDHPMRCRRALTVVLPLLTAAVVVGPTGSVGARPAVHGLRGPQLTAVQATVQPGGTLVLRGHGFPRNAELALLAGPPQGDASRIGSAQTGLRGGFMARIRIRAESSPGQYVVLACHDDCSTKASTRFRIASP